MAKRKRTNYYAFGKEEPLQTGDWVVLKTDPSLQEVRQVVIKPSSRLELLRFSPYLNNVIDDTIWVRELFDKHPTDPQGKTLLGFSPETQALGAGYEYLPPTKLKEMLDRTKRQVLWYEEGSSRQEFRGVLGLG